MPSRKSIAAALLALIAPPGGPFTVSGRRPRDPEGVAAPGAPALFLIKPHEKYERPEISKPPRRYMDFVAIIYTDVGSDPNAVPADLVDDLVDTLEALLTPTGPDTATGRQTLGGLVHDCAIDGDADFYPGDVQGKGETMIPIRVLLP